MNFFNFSSCEMPLHPLPATVKAFPAVAEREEELLVADIAEVISHGHALAMRGGTKTDLVALRLSHALGHLWEYTRRLERRVDEREARPEKTGG